MTKALVTGGAGLIGSHIVDLLLSKDYEVNILDNLEPQVHPEGRPEWIPVDIECLWGDVRWLDDVRMAVQGVDIVFHQAAFGGFTDRYSKYLDVNATGTARLYEETAKAKVKKCIVASSQAVYGRGGLLRESDVCNPNTPYGISKYAEERIALALGRQYGISTICLRYAVTYGPRQSLYNPYTGIISIFASRLMNGLAPIIFGDGLQVRDMIYVEDVADANVFVAENLSGGVYNVASGKSVSVLWLAKKLAELLEVDIEPEMPGLYRPQDVRDVLHETAKLSRAGWTAKTDIEDGLSRYVKWLKRQKDIPENFTKAQKELMAKGIIKEMTT